MAAVLPRGGKRAIATGLGTLQYRLSPSRRAGVHRNLTAIAKAHPPLLSSDRERDRVARAVFVNYQLAWVEYLGHSRRGHRFPPPRLRNAELLYRAIARGRGAVIAAPHVGNWELAGRAFAGLGFDVHVVTGVQLHARLTRAVRTLKERDRIRVSTPRDGFRPLLDTLHRGGVVILLVDGDIYSRTISAPFLGRRAAFPAGPALLSRRTGAALLHAHAARLENGDHMICFDALDAPDPALPFRADLARLTQRVAAVLESTVAAHAAEWCVLRAFETDDAA
jgi:lauroyl/myristoyl acyltransferase